MIARVAVRRFLAACLPAVLALLWVETAAAGLLTTDRMVPNFIFKSGTLDYRPTPEDLVPLGPLSASGRLLHIDGDPALGMDPLRGSLQIGSAQRFGNLADLPFNVFGSLPSADSLSGSELLSASVKSLDQDNKGRGLERLIDDAPIKGRLASRYRGAGIFTAVDGVDETSWIASYQQLASAVELIALEDANGTAPASALAAPIPSSFLLLLAGLPVLLFARTRARGRADLA